MTNQKNTTKTFILGTLIGSLIGATAGLLMAPQSGEETQQLLAEKGTELQQEAEKRIDESRHFTIEKLAEARTGIADWLSSGSEFLTEKSQQIKAQADPKPAK